ncbi:hypothetical protein FA95DRAFT_1560262 [Auriscalpium vulgare]|uniref:Uncharacterized protein n=1 Tax=Auriscalpium vulgare TaxID=40419 RepID=A0ACB8RR89_9AGAM|nr:hypothetical protein FA95DRAFT_1560262 [Auriscalpium vulgare]
MPVPRPWAGTAVSPTLDDDDEPASPRAERRPKPRRVGFVLPATHRLAHAGPSSSASLSATVALSSAKGNVHPETTRGLAEVLWTDASLVDTPADTSTARASRATARAVGNLAPTTAKPNGKRRASCSPSPTPAGSPLPDSAPRGRPTKSRRLERRRVASPSVPKDPSPAAHATSPASTNDELSAEEDSDGDAMYHASHSRPTHVERYAGARLKTRRGCQHCQGFKSGPRPCEFKPHMPWKCIKCLVQRKRCFGAIMDDGSIPPDVRPRQRKAPSTRSHQHSRASRGQIAPRRTVVPHVPSMLSLIERVFTYDPDTVPGPARVVMPSENPLCALMPTYAQSCADLRPQILA